MQALVAVDPTYLWGWHQLAEWYNETGRAESYLEAASELVRLQPGHPVALMMRGEAKLQTGDRDGGKADLREALKVSPGYSPAAAVLFDACLADDEYREARQVLAVLQEHAAGPEVAVKQIQLACRTDDADGAIARLRGSLRGAGTVAVPGAGRTRRTANRPGWKSGRCAYCAMRGRAAAHSTRGCRSSGSTLPMVRKPSRASACARRKPCIKAYPKFMPGHDCKAEQLALAGRFDEALAACKPAELDPLPVELAAARPGSRTAAAIARRRSPSCGNS